VGCAEIIMEPGLPEDVTACHELIRELILALESSRSDVALLKQRLQGLLRARHGSSTEKLSLGQLSLFREQLETLLEETASTVAGPEERPESAPSGSMRKRAGGGRKVISPSLPRVRKDYYPDESEMFCSCCGKRKKEFGVEIQEKLDYIPASFSVIERATHKFVCEECEEGVVEGQRPPQLHSGAKATEGMIAQVSVCKYTDHQPLYRQEQIYVREGAEVPRSSMGRWLNMSAQDLKGIVERMHELVLGSRVVQGDESPVKFIDKTRSIKKIKTGYVWALYGDDEHPYNILNFRPDRTAENARELLTGYGGILLTDGYGGYDWYERELSANCNVHLRRYLEKALKYDKEKAGLLMGMYSKIYEIEKRGKELTENQVLELRQRETVPILSAMKEKLEAWKPYIPPKTPLGIAINYALPRWDKLCRFTQYAFLRPDTNLVENAIRPVALGRKNWLHVGSEEALETASIHASLNSTCKRLNVNPYWYLRDVLIRLGQGADDLDELLPDRWTNQNLPHPT